MQAGQVLRFDHFHLDPQNARLWRGKRLITLTPKAFAVLCHLVDHAGQLVTKDALLTAVWPGIYVSEGVLSECVREIRHALGDTSQASRFIQTVHRRGYRFIAPLRPTPPVVSRQLSVIREGKNNARTLQLATGNWQLTTPLVGREVELRQLHTWWAKALKGARQLVFVTGEAGIGKTTVVDAFVARLSAKNNVWIGRGQCIEHYGQGEAYLPVLEALGRLCREPDGNQLIALLAQHAPTWLVQMPALLSTTDLEALQRRTQGATRERMLRELAEAVEVLGAERPLVLVLEDLHWSDVSTLDLLAFIARRRESARLLIIGAYRPVEVIVSTHALKAVKQELHLHGQCVELPLRFLTEEDVTTYLVRRFAVGARRTVPQTRGLSPLSIASLAQLIHQRTEGNPLFMVNLVDYLVTQGVLARIEGQWRLQGEIAAVARWVPESLQQMIEKQIERLSPQDRRVLETASVAGAEFSAAAVAAGAGIAVEAVEEQCGELARHEQFLRARGTAEWPDGTVAARYGFLHALYQDVLYSRLTARRRQRLHQQIGERVEQAYGERAKEIAAELAVHFEQGRDYQRAIQYLQQAGENAVRRSAHQEAISLLTKGLELLQLLPDTPERTQEELTLRITLGTPLMATKGWAALEVERNFIRARELCQHIGETPQLFPVVHGLLLYHSSRGKLHAARELAEQLLHLAQNTPSPDRLLRSHASLGHILYFLGEFALAREHLEQGATLSGFQKHRLYIPNVTQYPGVVCLCYAALALCDLGYPDQALKRVREALTLAQELAHPFSLTYVLRHVAVLHGWRGEWSAAQAQAEATITIATEQGFSVFSALGAFDLGWALVKQGQYEEGLARMRQGVADSRAIGTVPVYFLGLLAEACGKVGRPEEGLSMLAKALGAVDKNGMHHYEAELYRLKGELLLAQEGKNQKSKSPNSQYLTLSPQAEAEAEACFLKAVDIARKQQAKSLELRATVSLARLWRNQGKKDKALQMLAKIYSWFTEGFDTKDLQEAKALLEELS